MQIKNEELQIINQSLREKKQQGKRRIYISSLSVQLLFLSERISTTVSRKKTNKMI
ncbi:MAG TPA: hypothetical protein VLA48_06320 [Nitrososphaeraceae archaeon]|nr:hypothetical protein [Nitrososphaeraceae archaeon]